MDDRLLTSRLVMGGSLTLTGKERICSDRPRLAHHQDRAPVIEPVSASQSCGISHRRYLTRLMSLSSFWRQLVI